MNETENPQDTTSLQQESGYYNDLKDSDEFSVNLRQRGNTAFKSGKYHEAIELWLQSVKESLKRSVRFPSATLYENQLLCRLNLSMGYLKLEDWVEAKEQAELVLEQSPHNVKAMYRLAQAFEKIQSWPQCLELLKRIEKETIRYSEIKKKNEEENICLDDAPKNEKNHKIDNEDEDDNDYDPENIPSLHGFIPEELQRLIYEMRYRIGVEKKKYREKSKQVFHGIGKQLNAIGASENRHTSPPSNSSKTAKDENLHRKEIPKNIEIMKKQLDETSWPKLSWMYMQTTESSLKEITTCGKESEEENNRVTETNKEDSHKKLDANGQDDACANSVNNLIGVPIFKDSMQNETCSDDPKSDIWTQVWTASTLKNDKRVLALSLPLTVLRIINLLISNDRKEKAEKQQEDSGFHEDEKKTYVSMRNLRICLSWKISCQQSLIIHVLGARGDVEMESQWTAILRRLPNLKFLTIFFIGFLDKDDKWSKSLREGVLSPPLVKTKDLLPYQKLTCYLYKGMYQTFVKEHPGVLLKQQNHALHEYHPDIVVIPEPRLSLYFDSWIPVFDILLRLSIPLIITAYSAQAFSSHDALSIPYIVRTLQGVWTVPLHSNPYSIKIQPEPDYPPMILWAPEGETRTAFTGVSAKHAVTGCVVSKSFSVVNKNQTEEETDEKTKVETKEETDEETKEETDEETKEERDEETNEETWMPESKLAEIKEKLANRCDIDEEAQLMKQASEEKNIIENQSN